MIQDATTYVTEQGEKRDKGDEDNFITLMLLPTAVPNLRTDDYCSYFADITAGAVQYGGRTAMCNYLEPHKDESPEVIAYAIVEYGNTSGTVPDDYDRTILASTTIDVNSSGRPWSFQYCTEYGWFQTMSEEHPMRSTYVDEAYFS